MRTVLCCLLVHGVAAAAADFHIELHNSQKLMSLLHSGAAGTGSSGGGGGSSGSGSTAGSEAGSDSIRSRGGKHGADCVTVPKAHVSLCTSKILTMEWIDGLKVCVCVCVCVFL